MPFSPSTLRLSSLALAGGVLLLIIGLLEISGAHLLVHVRAYESLRWSLTAALAAWPLARALKVHLASALALVWLGAHVAMVGLVPVVAVALLALAALAIGTRLSARMIDQPALALLLGLAIVAAVTGWLLPLRLHAMWIYVLILVGLSYAGRNRIGETLAHAGVQWRSAVSASPRTAAIAIAALGITSIATWIPTMMSDDLAYHLALPTQLQQLGYYRMDPASQVWALAPWASDVLQAIAQVAADREARGSVNLLWLATGAWLMFGVCRAAGLATAWAWLGVGLSASLPMTAALAVSMQTELAAVAVLLALVTVIMRSEVGDRGHTLMLLAVLSGLLLQLKVSFVVPLIGLLLWQALRWRDQWPWRRLPRALLAGIAVGGASYTYAWGLAGNPLLPLYNQWFRSPYFSVEPFFDDRYGSGWSLDWLWQLVMHSGEVNEGWAGAGGFQYVALAGLLPLALLAPRTRALTLVALAYALTMYALMHYLRYIYPALVLLIPGLLMGLSVLPQVRCSMTIGIALLLLNLTFQSNASWPLRDGSVRSLLEQQGDPRRVLTKHVPERLLAATLDRHARVLIIGQPFHAVFGGRAFVANWYDQQLLRWSYRFRDATAAGTMRALLVEFGFTHVLIARNPQIPDMPARLASVGATRLAQENDASLWLLPVDDPALERRDLMRERDLARQLRHTWR